MNASSPLAAVLLSALLLAGCGDDDEDPSSDPTDRPTSSSPSPTETGPQPADGVEVDEPTFTFHLPGSWELQEPEEFLNTTVVKARPDVEADFTDLHVYTKGKRNFEDVRKLSGDVLENFTMNADEGVRQEPVTDWAGQPAYHFVGDGSLAGHMVEFGTIWKDKWIVVRFDFTVPGANYLGAQPEFELTPAEQQEIIDSVEASWEWK